MYKFHLVLTTTKCKAAHPLDVRVYLTLKVTNIQCCILLFEVRDM